MRQLRALFLRISGLFGKNRNERELTAEMESHLAMHIADNLRAGMTVAQARREAFLKLGGVEQTKENYRDRRGLPFLETLLQDLRFGARTLRKNPAFTAVAVLTLALGIGANTAIFTLVNAVLMKPLPVADPKQLFILGDTKTCCDTTDLQDNFALYSHALYKRVRDNTPEFSQIAAFQSWLQSFSVRRSGQSGAAIPQNGEFVSGNYFSTLGVPAFAGRALEPGDDQPNAAPVAVMSYRTWQQQYSLDPTVMGSTFTVNGQPVTIVGVAPPGFFGETLRGDPPAFWFPLCTEPVMSRDNPLLNQTNEYWLYAIGRLKPGIAPVRAQERVKAEIQQWLREEGGAAVRYGQQIDSMRLSLSPAGAGVGRLRSNYGEGLRLLMVVSGVVLLIACGNVANLLLARGTASRAQTAVRVALGAEPGRLVRQMLTESLLLSVLGGIAGVVVAFFGTRIILLLTFRGASYVPIEATPSLPVLGFALVVSLATGTIFGLAPAWIGSKTHPIEALRGTGRTIQGHSELPQKLLIGVQTGLSLVLLVGAGLLTQSLRNLEKQQFGLQTQSRLIVRVNPALAGYTAERLPGLYRRIQDRFRQIAGVQSASLALHSPMDGWNWESVIFAEGRTPSANPDQDSADYNYVSAHYFETIGTRVVRGRAIEEQDTPGGHFVTVVNEAFVKRFFPGQDALGRHLGMNEPGHSGDYEIVGVVEDTKYRNPKNPTEPMFFLPLLQIAQYKQATDNSYQVWANYIDSIQLRVEGRPENYQAIAQQTLADIDPNLPAIKIMTLEDQVSNSLNSSRLIALLTTLYGGLALVLGAIGLYGVSAYMVARRTSEIGIRVALGADRLQVVTMVLRNALRPIMAGLLIGVPLALGSGWAIASQLFGVKSYDPLIMGSAIGALTISAALAAIVPARRAASVDPLVALRHE